VNDGKRQKLKAAKSRREAALKTITACRLPPATCLPATAFKVHNMQSVVTFVLESFVLTFIG
jgi:hypothetical protein